MKPRYKALLIFVLFSMIALCFYPFAALSNSHPTSPDDMLALLTALGTLAAAIVSALAIRRVIISYPLSLPFLIIIPMFVLLAVGTIVTQSYQAAQADCFTPQSGYNYVTDYIGDGDGHFCRIKPAPDSSISPFLVRMGVVLVLTIVVTCPTILITTLLHPKKKSTHEKRHSNPALASR